MVALAVVMPSCAALWGFQDAVVATDAEARDADAASESAADVAVVRESASAPMDAPHEASLEVSYDASHDVAAKVDTGVPTPPACAPACGPGEECESAVGGALVCVASASTCTDTTDCLGDGCCVWLDESSKTGRCAAVGPSPAMMISCLCSGKQVGPPPGRCTCSLAPGQPSGGVEICSD
jgi:hypothetical protein